MGGFAADTLQNSMRGMIGIPDSTLIIFSDLEAFSNPFPTR